jgi:hypothetical protein
VAPDRTTLLVLRIAVGLFVLISVVGSLTFGERWFREGDPFEVLSRLYGQLSPLGRRPDGRLVLRTPVHGPSLLAPRRGLLATAAVMLGGTAYDSLTADNPVCGLGPVHGRAKTWSGPRPCSAWSSSWRALHLAAAVSAWLSHCRFAAWRRIWRLRCCHRGGIPCRPLLLAARLPGTTHAGR